MAEAQVKSESVAGALNLYSTCFICLEQLKSPKCLPCMHLFCKDCLKQHIEKQHLDHLEGSSLSSFPCPVCRQNTIPLVTSDSYLIWAERYPSDELLSAVEKSKALHATEKTCKLCKVKDNPSITADLWCKNCSSFFCSNCKPLHDTLLADHTMYTLDEITRDPLSAVRYPTRCKKHSEISHLFCIKHEQTGCQLCMADHKDCGKIEKTAVTRVKIQQQKEIQALVEKLDAPIADIRGLIETVSDHFENQEIDKSIAESQLEMIMEEIKKYFLERVVNLYKEGKEKNASKLKRCKQLEFALKHLRSSLLVVLELGDDADVVMVNTRGNAQLQKYCSELHNEFKRNEIERLAVVPNVIKSLKKINIAKNTTSCYNPPLPLTNMKSFSLKVELQCSFDVLLPIDSQTCDITDILFYEKDRIIAVDSANSSIKLITNTGEHLSHLSVPGCEVWGVCQMDQKSFAVSCGSSRKILIVDVDTDNLVVRHTVIVNHSVYGIAYTGKSFIVTDGATPSTIRDYSTDGKELFSRNGLRNMKHIVRLPKSGKLVASGGGEINYVSEKQKAERDILVEYENLKYHRSKPLLTAKYVYNLNRFREYELESESLSEVQALAVDEMDNVVFVGCTRGEWFNDYMYRVMLISQDGQHRELLSFSNKSKREETPVAISKYRSSFVLSAKQNNTLKVYSMF